MDAKISPLNVAGTESSRVLGRRLGLGGIIAHSKHAYDMRICVFFSLCQH